MIKNSKVNKVPVSEIFSSFQGEGIFVGVPQVFVRFSGCNLKKCVFCDEKAPVNFSMEMGQIISCIKKLSRKIKPHSVSLTGGEPLLYPVFLKELCKRLKEEGFCVYLETNGTLPENFKKVKKYIDFIAMDIKLPSATGLRSYFAEHIKFLEAAGGKKIFVKVVVTKKTEFSCFKKAVDLVKSLDEKIPFVIQPATKTARAQSPGEEKILFFCGYAIKFLKDVKVIPQMHKIWGAK